MKILAIADLHGSEKARSTLLGAVDKFKPDVVCIAGDITHFGPASWALDVLNAIPTKTYAIHGNCDLADVVSAIDRSKAINLHRKIVIDGDFAFIGFGGEGYSVIPVPEDVREKKIIIVAHQPPYGYLDTVATGKHIGNVALRDLIRKCEPLVVICAHVHESRGKAVARSTAIVNPGEARMGYFAVLDVSDESVDIKLMRAD